MPVFDTGPIENRNQPRTTSITIRLQNTGQHKTKVGVEVYTVTPTGNGVTNETVYALNL